MDMAERMISRDDQFDLFGIGYDYGGFEYMMEKGYCYDLSSDRRIEEQINRMYPFLQQAVKMGDHIYGVPISVDGSGWGYSATNLQAVGINLPDSYERLLDLYYAAGQLNAHQFVQQVDDKLEMIASENVF